MKYLVIIILLLFGVSAYPGVKDKKLNEKEIKELIENQQFQFIARSATPLSGSTINLTSQYDLKIDSMKITSWLPYYGRAYQVEYGGEGGIKFDETAKSYKIKFNEKKKSYHVLIEVDTQKDNYKLNMDIGLSGYASLNVTSVHRQSISFYGTIEPIEE